MSPIEYMMVVAAFAVAVQFVRFSKYPGVYAGA